MRRFALRCNRPPPPPVSGGMDVVVFGSTGRVGAACIETLRARGANVVAVARNPAKLATEGIRAVAGDIRDPSSVTAALTPGPDVIVNVVGGDVFAVSDLVTTAARTIVASAVAAAPQARYLAITGVANIPARGAGALAQFVLRRSPLRHVVADHQGAYDIVTASPLAYTLFACPWIKDGPGGRPTIVPDAFPGGFHVVSPESVATAIVDEAFAAAYVRRVVAVWDR
jgi:uncharacterized protein YbjT (DUF2867 family)